MRKDVVRKVSTQRANETLGSLDMRRMSVAELVRPPSAVKRARASKASWKALKDHQQGSPTREHAVNGEYVRMAGEKVDTALKGEKLLVNLAARAHGAGTMFNRGQISDRELRAAVMLCELAERAQMSQLSGVKLAERVDGGQADVDGSRLRAAATAAGKYRDALETLSQCGRLLVENVIVLGMPLEEAVRVRRVADRLGGAAAAWRAKKAMVLVRDALDHLADQFHLADD